MNDKTAFLLCWLTCFILGCAGPEGHFVDSGGMPRTEVDYLWEEVNRVFPDALPEQVKLVMVSGPHATFMIESNAIGIPTAYPSRLRRGKVCRTLTHLALHYLSGGDDKRPGRCFDNDVVFLEQAVAGYMDHKGAERLKEALESSTRLAAGMIREGGLTALQLRDWETFYYRGFWSDQFRSWNIEGLRALETLGDYLARTYGLGSVGRVFERLGDDRSLDEAVREVFQLEVETLLNRWQEDVLARAAVLGEEEEEESGDRQS
jgi:hypothetical protein